MQDILPHHNAHIDPCFSWQNRVMRLLWGIVYVMFFRFSPRPCHAWRAMVLRCFGAKLGRGCHIYPQVIIWAPWNLHCQNYVGIADRAILYNQALVSLGENVVISQGAHVCTGTHDYEDEYFSLITKPIFIGPNVWIGAEAFILPGITVGEGAVVGARSVVTKDIPSWTVCAGHPCKIIKNRILRKHHDAPVGQS